MKVYYLYCPNDPELWRLATTVTYKIVEKEGGRGQVYFLSSYTLKWIRSTAFNSPAELLQKAQARLIIT